MNLRADDIDIDVLYGNGGSGGSGEFGGVFGSSDSNSNKNNSSSSNPYNNIPIESFGAAMLRGM